MKSYTLHIILLLIMLLVIQAASAQDLSVRSMELLPNDITAMDFNYQRQDLNDDYTGIIKVMIALDGVEFEGNGVMEQKCHRSGEYWVWMAKGSKRIKVYAPGFLPMDLNFFDDYGIRIESKKAYALVITIPTGNVPDNINIQTFTVKGVSFNLVRVEGGKFQMGGKNGNYDERPVHKVTLSEYKIGETEVTQELWEVVMGTNVRQQRDKAVVYEELRLYGEGKNYPMYYVSWLECQEFISKLNSLTGQQFRLPTEAEWEFAARGGNKSKKTMYSGSDKIEEVAWCYYNSDQSSHPVRTKQKNELGIYDMSGNVSEWCEDLFDYYSSSPQINPKGPEKPVRGDFRVFRGGSWNDSNGSCLVYGRGSGGDAQSSHVGFRLAL